ncbi:MAG: hypothetical protein NTU57_05525 [Candidatus Aenigmarchaeota archaeon]|nr:hypothetical protein [Candidatus Aenigmarchaeota archaeon]
MPVKKYQGQDVAKPVEMNPYLSPAPGCMTQISNYLAENISGGWPPKTKIQTNMQEIQTETVETIAP